MASSSCFCVISPCLTNISPNFIWPIFSYRKTISKVTKMLFILLKELLIKKYNPLRNFKQGGVPLLPLESTTLKMRQFFIDPLKSLHGDGLFPNHFLPF